MNEQYSQKVQKALNKLIAEEWLAGNMYRFYVTAVNSDDRGIIYDLFMHISEDELNEHMKDLIDWALENGYSVPSCISDCEKYADDKLVKLTKNVRKDQKVEFYVNKAIESEQIAIEGYAEIINSGILTDTLALESIIVRNYYDELEHMEQLGLLKYANEMTVQVG